MGVVEGLGSIVTQNFWKDILFRINESEYEVALISTQYQMISSKYIT